MSTLKVNTIESETPTVNITDGLNVSGIVTATSFGPINVGTGVTISSNGNIGISGICTAGGGIHVGAAATVSGLSRRKTHGAITLTNQSEVDWTGF